MAESGKYTVAVTALLLLLGGCGRGGRSGEPGLIVGGPDKKIEEMTAGDVIVVVNGEALTKARYETMLQNTERAFKEAKPNAPEGQLKVFMAARRTALVREFISRKVYLQEAGRRKLTVTPERRAHFEGVFRAQAQRGGRTLDELAKNLGDTRTEFARRIEERALIAALMEDEFGDSLELTDEDVSKKIESNRRYNAMCQATNQLVKARGEQIVRELKGGADFQNLAARHSESDTDENGFWDELTRPEIEDVNVRHAAFTLPVGAVSEPIETDEGLVIIKVLERTGVDAVVSEEPATVKLGRILLRLGAERVMPPEEDFRRQLAESKKNHYLQRFMQELQPRARIEFPNGTNLWEQTKGKSVLDALQ